MSTAVFALKAGGGLACLFGQKPGGSAKTILTLGFMLMYGLVFLLSGWILSSVDLTRHVDTLQTFFKSGMTLHFVLAILMAAWGIHILTASGSMESGSDKKISRGWILLVVPCPVCFTVILLSCAFTCALYPGNGLVFWGLYGGFILVSLTAALTFFAIIYRSENPEKLSNLNAAQPSGQNPTGHFLGTLMIYIAGYFVLSVIIIPQFADLEQVYRLSTNPDPFIFSRGQVIVFLICLTALLSGFVYRFTLLLKRD